MQRINVQYLSVDQIEPAPFNPAFRTSDKALQTLISTIKSLGGIQYPLMVSKDMKLIDGHRRLAAAKKLGIREVPVIITNLSLQQGWAEINTGNRPQKDAEWVAAFHQGLSETYIPTQTKRNLRAIRELLGDDGIAMLAERAMSTHVISWARKVARYVGDESPAFKAKALAWLIEQNQQTPARRAMEFEIAPNELKRAVNSGLKLKPVWVAS